MAKTSSLRTTSVRCRNPNLQGSQPGTPRVPRRPSSPKHNTSQVNKRRAHGLLAMAGAQWALRRGYTNLVLQSVTCMESARRAELVFARCFFSLASCLLELSGVVPLLDRCGSASVSKVTVSQSKDCQAHRIHASRHWHDTDHLARYLHMANFRWCQGCASQCDRGCYRCS